MNSHEIIKLNVGGVKYTTTKSTLCSDGSSTFFSQLVSGSIPSATDDEGNIFIDRDGRFFACILSYLRDDVLEVPPGATKKQIQRELDFYCIQATLTVEHSSSLAFRPEGLYVDDEDDAFSIQNDNELLGFESGVGARIIKTPLASRFHHVFCFGNSVFNLNKEANSFTLNGSTYKYYAPQWPTISDQVIYYSDVFQFVFREQTLVLISKNVELDEDVEVSLKTIRSIVDGVNVITTDDRDIEATIYCYGDIVLAFAARQITVLRAKPR